MGDERRDDADQQRADVYSSARIGAAAALTLILVALLVVDALHVDYTADPTVAALLLGAIGGLLGVEVLGLVRHAK